MSKSPSVCLPERLCFSHHCRGRGRAQESAGSLLPAPPVTASALHPTETWHDLTVQLRPPLLPPRSPPAPRGPCAPATAPHLHEGVEQRVRVLLLPGISHGLLYLKAVLDIRLEPLAKLEEHIKGKQERAMNKLCRIWLQAEERVARSPSVKPLLAFSSQDISHS